MVLKGHGFSRAAPAPPMGGFSPRGICFLYKWIYETTSVKQHAHPVRPIRVDARPRITRADGGIRDPAIADQPRNASRREFRMHIRIAEHREALCEVVHGA